MDAKPEGQAALRDQDNDLAGIGPILDNVERATRYGGIPPSFVCTHANPGVGCGRWQLHRQARYTLQEVQLNDNRCPDCNHADGLERE